MMVMSVHTKIAFQAHGHCQSVSSTAFSFDILNRACRGKAAHALRGSANGYDDSRFPGSEIEDANEESLYGRPRNGRTASSEPNKASRIFDIGQATTKQSHISNRTNHAE